MRISDWSSDVCSSDLLEQFHRTRTNFCLFTSCRLVMKHRTKQTLMRAHMASYHYVFQCTHFGKQADILKSTGNARLGHLVRRRGREIGRATCRERVCKYL